MKLRFLKFCSVALTIYAVSGGAVPTDSSAKPANTTVPLLKVFLRNYLKSPWSEEDTATEYYSVAVDLNDSKIQQILVYVIGPSWCGSGGCPMFVLQRAKDSFHVISKTMVVQLPIRLLTSKTNGWHDIGVRVQGGGIRQSYEALLPFNGQKYPLNPSMSPARRLRETVLGKILISDTSEAIQLYE